MTIPIAFKVLIAVYLVLDLVVAFAKNGNGKNVAFSSAPLLDGFLCLGSSVPMITKANWRNIALR